MKPYTIVIDFETANPSPTSACSVGFVVLQDFKIIHESVHLIRTPTESFFFTHIHGLTWKDVKNAPTFDEVWENSMKPWFENSSLMVAHNIGFDDRVLRASAGHYGITVPRIKTECTVKLARYKLGIRPAKLSNVAEILGIPLNHHEALSDARASAMIYIHTLTGTKPWEDSNASNAKSEDFEGLDRILKLNSPASAEKLRQLLLKAKTL
jgi:DNA polymerase-3 subunit epsilon